MHFLHVFANTASDASGLISRLRIVFQTITPLVRLYLDYSSILVHDKIYFVLYNDHVYQSSP